MSKPMNEQYLSRGKRVDNLSKEFVIGHYVSVPRPMIVLEELQQNGSWYWFEVDPATIGRCTGLPDCNGKLIFEGDIVRVIADEEEPEIWSVAFNNLRWELKCPIYEHQGMEDFVADYISLEIIGNIHDKPELMEDAE